MSNTFMPAFIAAVAIATLLGGCSSPPPAVPTPTETNSEEQHYCTNPEGGMCLGTVDAGTYTTVVMNPTITYTLPDGWSNWEDTPGNFLLVPPDNTLAGVNGGTSDFIGVYTQIAASTMECEQVANPAVGTSPKDIATFFATAPEIDATEPEPATVGGLSGYVVDTRQPEGTGLHCDSWVLTPTFVGTGPSDLTHSILAGMVIRHYLLEYNNATLVIEIVDVSGGDHLEALDAVAQQLVFGD